MILGTTVGAEIDFISFLVRRYFEPAAFSRLYGLTFGAYILGSGVGPLILAQSFDRLGGYRPGLLLLAVLCGAVALLSFWMPCYVRPSTLRGRRDRSGRGGRRRGRGLTAMIAIDTAQAERDRQAIRQAVDDWVLWRDAGERERLTGLWASDGYMMTTWSQAPAVEFVARSRHAFENGLRVLHSLGGCSIDLAGDRAVAQTKMQILQRAPVEGVLADVTCQGRFWDAFERRDGRWLLVLRQPIYELDQIRPVDPSARLNLDAETPGRLAGGLPPPRLPAGPGSASTSAAICRARAGPRSKRWARGAAGGWRASPPAACAAPRSRRRSGLWLRRCAAHSRRRRCSRKAWVISWLATA